MTAKFLSEMWATLVPALGDHLWQSTLFAMLAGLLTQALRKNHARARYWLWLAASLKFLLPFSLLVALGSHLGTTRTLAVTNARLYSVMAEGSRPFTLPTVPMSSGLLSSTASPPLLDVFPPILAALWLCGFVIVLSAWYVRWRNISAVIRNAVPVHEGREVEALRRMERIAGIRQPIKLLLLPASLEPGIFGIARPALLWPQGISEHLGDAHLEAIFAHEVWHVRRRDNLAAALHMGVEAILWFHPLVWWLGARLVDERERACDEHVLQLGSERQVYAESILKTCEFCAGFRLTCVSGVTGADLNERIVHIMTQHAAHKLDFTRKLLLGAAGLLAIAVPIVFGLLTATPGRAASPLHNPATITRAIDALPTNRDQPAAKAPLPVSKLSKAIWPKAKKCSKSVSVTKAASSAKLDAKRER